MVRGVTLSGLILDVLKSIDTVGKDLRIRLVSSVATEKITKPLKLA